VIPDVILERSHVEIADHVNVGLLTEAYGQVRSSSRKLSCAQFRIDLGVRLVPPAGNVLCTVRDRVGRFSPSTPMWRESVLLQYCFATSSRRKSRDHGDAVQPF
jgi:hypothetical protein